MYIAEVGLGLVLELFCLTLPCEKTAFAFSFCHRVTMIWFAHIKQKSRERLWYVNRNPRSSNTKLCLKDTLARVNAQFCSFMKYVFPLDLQREEDFTNTMLSLRHEALHTNHASVPHYPYDPT